MESLSQHLEELGQRKDLEGAVICSAKEGVFIAGADIEEIKGVTYHGLSIEETDDGYCARIVFDI